MIVQFIDKKTILYYLRNGIIKIDDLFDTFDLKFSKSTNYENKKLCDKYIKRCF